MALLQTYLLGVTVTFDYGVTWRMHFTAAAVYWVTVLWIALRRRTALTPSDAATVILAFFVYLAFVEVLQCLLL